MDLTARAWLCLGLLLKQQTCGTAKAMSARVLVDKYNSMLMMDVYDHFLSIGSPSEFVLYACHMAGRELGLQSLRPVASTILSIRPC